MQRTIWFILFLCVNVFYIWNEHAYILIYYTIWTFLLETLFFGLFYATSPRLRRLQHHLFETIFAPSIVVFIGFWTMIAPVYMNNDVPKNIVLIFVTHGLNALAMISEMQELTFSCIWKPTLYTIVYNLFLIIYVSSGGRSISGKLPYWYAKYDQSIGWVFAVISTMSVVIVHIISSLYVWPIQQPDSKRCIV